MIDRAVTNTKIKRKVTKLWEKNNIGVMANIVLNFLIKGVSVGVSFLLVPMYYSYFNSKEMYGLWLTIVSIVSWMNILDIGLSNGLRNRLTGSITRKEKALSQQYISTSYILLTLVMAVASVIVVIASGFINWQHVLKDTTLDSKTIQSLLIIIFITCAIRFVLQLVNALFYAIQKAFIPGLILVITNILMLIFLLLNQSVFKISGIISFAYIYGILNILPMLVASVIAYVFFYRDIRPRFRGFSKGAIKNLMSKGVVFFIIQMMTIIIYSTDSFIINNQLGAAAVVDYQVTYKVFSITFIAFNLILGPIWSAVTKELTNNNFEWIRDTYYRLLKLFVVAILGVFVLVIIFEQLIALWMGENFIINCSNIKHYMAAFTIIVSWGTIHANIINGTSKLKVQLITSIIAGVSNIPMSIYLAVNLGLGVNGVILGSVISQSLFAVFGAIQLNRIISKGLKEKDLQGKELQEKVQVNSYE